MHRHRYLWGSNAFAAKFLAEAVGDSTATHELASDILSDEVPAYDERASKSNNFDIGFFELLTDLWPVLFGNLHGDTLL